LAPWPEILLFNRERLGYGLRLHGAATGGLAPGQEVEDLRAGIGHGVGHAWRDADQGAPPGYQPFPDLPGGFPDQDPLAVEQIKPLLMAGVQMVVPAVAGFNEDEVAGAQDLWRVMQPVLPGEEAEAPLTQVQLAVKVDKFQVGH
jgi:hypothetical protein